MTGPGNQLCVFFTKGVHTMHLVHIAIGTLCAVIGYVLGIYYPLMPMTALIAAGLLYHTVIAAYKRRRAAELQLILDIKGPTCGDGTIESHDDISDEMCAAFQRMQANL